VRILFDECLPRPLALQIAGHEIRTVQEEGWAGKSNGTLLSLLSGRFDVFVTVDRNLVFNEDVSGLKVAVIVLHAKSNRLEDLEPLAPKILEAIGTVRSGQVIHLSK
jgi:uncharacterized protein DUF5615